MSRLWRVLKKKLSLLLGRPHHGNGHRRSKIRGDIGMRNLAGFGDEVLRSEFFESRTRTADSNHDGGDLK